MTLTLKDIDKIFDEYKMLYIQGHMSYTEYALLENFMMKLVDKLRSNEEKRRGKFE